MRRPLVVVVAAAVVVAVVCVQAQVAAGARSLGIRRVAKTEAVLAETPEPRWPRPASWSVPPSGGGSCW